MIFVDTDVFMYAVGRGHPLRGEAQQFFEQSMSQGHALATSAEVLQELLHAYLPVGREETLDAAWVLVETVPTVWPVAAADVLLARRLAHDHVGLGARDLLHLATCRRHAVRRVQTFDRALAAAFTS